MGDVKVTAAKHGISSLEIGFKALESRGAENHTFLVSPILGAQQ